MLGKLSECFANDIMEIACQHLKEENANNEISVEQATEERQCRVFSADLLSQLKKKKKKY